MKILRMIAAASAAFFFAYGALAQNAGTVTSHAFAVGKGPGVTGFTSLLCGSAQLAVGQAAADPICQTISGDATLSAAGALTLGTVNSNVGSFGSATQSVSLTVNAKGLITAASASTITPAIGSVTGLGTGCGTFLATPSSANLRACLTDESGTGLAYFQGGALGTPSSATLTNATGLPVSGLASQAAWSFVVNNTSGSASPTAVDIASFTAKASPAGTDLIVISDQAASGALKRATISSIASAGSVASINGQTGAITSYYPPQGRLTLQTGTPVMTTTQSAKTTIYYTPYQGNMMPIYDGTNMVPTAFSEVSVATTDTTKNPAAIGASKVNDWFVWNDSGTIRLSHGPDWTNDTTRSAGTALTMVNGIYLNNASITNGPAASRGTYVGTTRSNGSSQLDYIFGASASGGTAAFFGVWNCYNRVSTGTNVIDSGVSYTYATGTVRQARASAGNQISFVLGLAEDAVQASYVGEISVLSAANSAASFGLGFDSTTAYGVQRVIIVNQASSITQRAGLSVSAPWSPGIGLHVLSANEQGDGTNSNTFNISSLNSLSAMIRN